MSKQEILIGITAGIAAYKTAELVSRLVQSGYGVSVMMTREADALIGRRIFQALTGRMVQVEMFSPTEEAIPHIESGRKASLLCIAPATANILGKAAHGIADDLLSTTVLAFDGPILWVPAMNVQMWKNLAVQRNLSQLRADGYQILGPESGHLACGETGMGRMVSPETIFQAIERYFSSQESL